MKVFAISATCLIPFIMLCTNTWLSTQIEQKRMEPNGNVAPEAANDFFSAIRIKFEKPEYRFTLAEVKAGISIPYNVIVDSDYKGIGAICQDTGGASSPNEFGLIIFPYVAGSSMNADGTITNQYFGNKDIGFGGGGEGGSRPPGTIKKGVHAQLFEWTGCNWHGPSDTGRPFGPPFPAGEYTLVVSCKGEQRLDGKNETFLFEVLNVVKVILTE